MVMVIDTSALIAILYQEPDAGRFALVIERAEKCVISAVTRVELTCVAEGSRTKAAREDLELLLGAIGPEIIPVDLAQMALAIEAFRTFGKGRHKAALNIGDCFSHALAKARHDTLLFKGNDFAMTDIIAA
jgi:ribonuclease VapC